MMPSDTTRGPDVVEVQPLVVMNVVDHLVRTQTQDPFRVIGVILGSYDGNRAVVANSFALPFDELPNEGHIWASNEIYRDKLVRMFNKINTKERPIGFYSSGSEIRKNDTALSHFIEEICPDPIFLLVDVSAKEMKRTSFPTLPVKAFVARSTSSLGLGEELVLRPVEIKGQEAEIVGVEALLAGNRDIRGSSYKGRMQGISAALKRYKFLLLSVQGYKNDIMLGKKEANHELLVKIQEVLLSIPRFDSHELSEAFREHEHDTELATYMGQMTRAIMGMHRILRDRMVKLERQEDEKRKDAEDKENVAKSKAKKKVNV